MKYLADTDVLPVLGQKKNPSSPSLSATTAPHVLSLRAFFQTLIFATPINTSTLSQVFFLQSHHT